MDFSTEDVATIKSLLSEFDDLRTFDQVKDWDARANDMLEKMTGLPEAFEERAQKLNAQLEEARLTRKQLPFLKRMFASKSAEQAIQADIFEMQQGKQRAEDWQDKLQECVDLTPDTPEARKELVQEFKARKKELQLEKREVAAEMAAIRVDARQQSANAGRGKYGAYDRRQIRSKKETALQPHEDNKAAITRQMLKIDKTIHWLERFK